MNALMKLNGLSEADMTPEKVAERRALALTLVGQGMKAETIRLKVKEATGVGVSTRYVRELSRQQQAAQWDRPKRQQLAMELAKKGMRYQAIYDTVKKQTGKCVSAEFVLAAIRAAGIVKTRSKPRKSDKSTATVAPLAAPVVTESKPLSDIDLLRGLESLFRGVSDASASRIFKAYLVLGGAQ